MESVLGRYRNLIILVGVLFLQVLGLAVQVKRGNSTSEEKDTRLIRIWAVGAVSPFERGLVWLRNGTGNIWHNYFYLRGVRAENRQLKERIEQMRLEQVRLTEDATQAHRLQILLAFKEQYISKTVAAQVIGSSGSDLSRVIYIDKGEKSGIKRDMAVITAEGVVGKVLLVYPNEAQVLLISDQSSGVGAILEKSRLQGVIRGTANGEVVLEKVMSDEQVPSGETVLTSGGDRIFPKGMPIGTVTKVGPGKDLFLNIKIKPAADLSRLEEVLVLIEKQDRQPVADDNVRIRAADILAQRLPSVPDKPVIDPNAPPSAAPGATKPASAATTGTTAVSAQKTSPTTGTTGVPTQKTPVGGVLATKPASAASPQQGINRGTTPVPLRPPLTSTSTTTPVTTPKPKILEDPLAPKPEGGQPEGTKPEGAKPEPPIIEQRPAKPPTVPPNSQPPNEDNRPQ
jgi:rod shape-determining protein MreC